MAFSVWSPGGCRHQLTSGLEAELGGTEERQHVVSGIDPQLLGVGVVAGMYCSKILVMP